MKVKKLDEDMTVVNETTPVVEDVQVASPTEKTPLDKGVESYRRYANIEESFEVTSDNIDEWALNEASVASGVTRSDLKHALLHEDTIDEVSRKLDMEVETTQDQTIIEQELDKSLKRAKWMQKHDIRSNFPNKLFVSLPGAGKTSIIYKWARENNVNIVYKDCKTMDLASLGGILTKPTSPDDQYAGRMATKEFHVLDHPDTVLFLDELNRASGNIQGSLLTLINDHTVWDPSQKGEVRYLPNFLFTIAAINPPSLKDPALKPLGTAMSNRFKRIETPGKPYETLNYLRSYYNDLISKEDDEEMLLELKGKLSLAETILSDSRFVYDTAKDEDEMADDNAYQTLSPRSFVNALESSDGTKEGFLDEWSSWCNYKKKPVIEDILHNYVDVADKANDALAGGTQSSVFAKREDDIRGKLRKLGIDV